MKGIAIEGLEGDTELRRRRKRRVQWTIYWIVLFCSLGVWVLSIVCEAALFVETVGDWYIGGVLSESTLVFGVAHEDDEPILYTAFDWHGWSDGCRVWGTFVTGPSYDGFFVTVPAWLLTGGALLAGSVLFFGYRSRKL